MDLTIYDMYKRLGWSDIEIWQNASETTACDDDIDYEEED